ncbi:hypothetical protein HNQ56_003727 [Anaerotaenia torta]|uniref:hypothetical protein n=1 Tax=Anaerotaenia torta TaxID=433293 RepID=UPI003D2316B1
MAKRYARINWKNSPSTSTPVNEPNLNQMDKGIKDCDDAIGDLALLKTTAKADLVAAINEQNDNLASKTINLSSSLDTSLFTGSLILGIAGNKVTLTADLTVVGTLGSRVTAATLPRTPADYRPLITVRGTPTGRNTGGWEVATYYTGALFIGSNGVIEIVFGAGAGSVKYVNFAIEYPLI